MFVFSILQLPLVKGGRGEIETKKSRKALTLRDLSGERGIRTPGTSQYNGFQDRRDRPLCHLSKTSLAGSALFQKRCKGTTIF